MDLLADEFEAGQHVLQLNAPLLAEGIGHVRRHNGLDRHGGQPGGGLFIAAEIIQHQDAHFIAGDEDHVVSNPDAGAHPVRIRIGGKAEIGPGFHAFPDGQIHGFPDFGIRIGAGREMPVGVFLLLDHIHADIAHAAQNLPDRDVARAVQGRIHHMQGLIDRMNPERQDLLIIGLNGLLRDIGDGSGGQRAVKIRQDVCQHGLTVDKPGDPVRGLEGDLAAVAAVNLVAVELGGIVRGGDQDAGRAAQMTHGKGEHRRGLQLRIEIHPDAHLRQGGGGQLHKIPGVNPAVAGQGDGGGGAGLLQIGAEAPGGAKDREKIHPVRAGAENAAQAAGTEGEIPVKAVILSRVIHGTQI